jgi:hypothetical protein
MKEFKKFKSLKSRHGWLLQKPKTGRPLSKSKFRECFDSDELPWFVMPPFKPETVIVQEGSIIRASQEQLKRRKLSKASPAMVILFKTFLSHLESLVREKYRVDHSELGHGHYGVVRKCQNRQTKEYFAVKTIKKSKVGRLETLKREIEILKTMDHPNIIKLVDVFEDDKYLHLVTELCTGGELFDRIIEKTKSAEGHYSEQDAATIIKSVLSAALKYCHTVHNICHRDLKPENFLFATVTSRPSLVPLSSLSHASRFLCSPPPIVSSRIDFGLSRYDDDQAHVHQSRNSLLHRS